MSDVYLLGAGFSHSINSVMPLMPVLSRQVVEALEQVTGRMPDLKPFAQNLEHWLSYLATDQPWLATAENLENRARYHRATLAVMQVVRQAEHIALLDSIDGPPEWLVELAALWRLNNSHIITFNYDTLVERALTHSGQIESCADLYVLPLVGGNQNGRTLDTWYTFDAHKLAMMKMHGSLNWKYSGLLASSSDPVHLVGNPERGWHGHKDEFKYVEFDKPYLEPLIVPPTAEKGPYYSVAALRYQWHLARETLGRAETVTIIGYSMPETDRAICDLVGTSFSPDSFAGRRVVVVDVSSAIVERLRRMLPDSVNVDDRFCGIADPIPQYVASMRE